MAMRKLMVCGGALAAALVAGACESDRAAGPGRAVNGRSIGAAVADRLEFDGGGQLSRLTLRDTSVRASFRRGQAHALGTALAIAPGGPRRAFHAAWMDSASATRHEIDAAAAPGAPVHRFRIALDQRFTVDLVREWRLVDGVFVLAGERAEVRVRGRLVRFTRELRGVEVARAPMTARLESAFGVAGSLVAPQPLHAAVACWKEALDYAAATVALAAATELAIVSPDKFSAGMVWVAAWENWRKKLERYADCMSGVAARN